MFQHQKVSFLIGGLEAWKEVGGEIESGEYHPRPRSNYIITGINRHLLTTREDLLEESDERKGPDFDQFIEFDPPINIYCKKNSNHLEGEAEQQQEGGGGSNRYLTKEQFEWWGIKYNQQLFNYHTEMRRKEKEKQEKVEKITREGQMKKNVNNQSIQQTQQIVSLVSDDEEKDDEKGQNFSFFFSFSFLDFPLFLDQLNSSQSPIQPSEYGPSFFPSTSTKYTFPIQSPINNKKNSTHSEEREKRRNRDRDRDRDDERSRSRNRNYERSRERDRKYERERNYRSRSKERERRNNQRKRSNERRRNYHRSRSRSLSSHSK